MNECVNGNSINTAPTGVGIPVKKLSGSVLLAFEDSSFTLYKASLKQEKMMKIRQAKAPIPLFWLKIDMYTRIPGAIPKLKKSESESN